MEKQLTTVKRRFLQTRGRDRPFAKLRSSKVRRDVLGLEKRTTITLYYLKDQGSMKNIK